MLKKYSFFLLSIIVTSCIYNVSLNNKDKNIILKKPLSILMYSPNYNLRPSKSKIDTIIIHHTAPFYSLTRVGYYFQDINSRVSSHYIVGKEGLIIESVSEEKRAWHAGYSSWKGKFNVNDYSIGIEVLNDGDGKDIWTEAQYTFLAQLTAYLMKKYDISLERVIGHRDIAIPLGRKIDPADNFDWNYFKNKIRNYLDIKEFSYSDNPQSYNDNPKDLIKKLSSDNLKERIDSINSFLTVKNSNYINDIKEKFKNEKYTSIIPYYYRFFSIYKDKSFINNATEIINNYNNVPLKLFLSAIEYLYENDKDNLFLILINLINSNIDERYKQVIIPFIANYSKKEIIDILIKNYHSSKSKDTKISIIQSMENIKNNDVRLFLLNELERDNLTEIKVNIINSLKANYDKEVESKLLKLLDIENNSNIINSIAINLIRNKSIDGILKLQKEEIFNVLTNQNKLALINMCGILKVSEGWLINNSSTEKDRELLSAYLISISRFKSERAFNCLISRTFDDKELEFTRIKALGYFNNEKINKLIKDILIDRNSMLEYKLLALSFISDRKMKSFLPLLKTLYVETNNTLLEKTIKETINLVENYSDKDIEKYL
ncbi:MAG: hypothetical protein KatS3mg068_2190 [Candidatus Sericytochromatia bacterium]|nr:MAG: hypothetical protein KatS3mg068_2190 [Candidatus Sericytochromatia bacterium]